MGEPSMTNEEAKEYLILINEEFKKLGFSRQFTTAIETLTSNPWHKASEELPEPLTYVIVRFSNNTMAVSQRTNHFIGETTTVKVTHWMEIPEIKED